MILVRSTLDLGAPMTSRALVLLATVLLLWGAACTTDGGVDGSSSSTTAGQGTGTTEERTEPTGEGTEPTERTGGEDLGDVERRVAEALGPQLADQGLELDSLTCPDLPVGPGDTARCDAVLSGVEGTITLEGAPPGSDDDLKATLDPGVISSALLVGEIERQGLEDPDCGAPAYESVPGEVITCTATDPETGREVTVEATITDGEGGVTMTLG